MKDKRQVQGFTINAICELTGYDRRTVTNRLQGVEPIGTEGKAQKFLIRQFIEACENRIRASLVKGEDGEALDPVYERARKDKEQADKTALENQVRRGELLEVSDVKRIWTDHIASAKSAVRSIPSKLAPVVAAETDPNVVNEILMDGVNEALEELGE
jgi:phage terminase Nu1 subunit (DNA packaging protein)